MFNIVATFHNDQNQDFRYFTTHVYDSCPVPQNKGIPTPFLDENDQILYAKPEPTEEERKFMNEESIRTSLSRTKSRIKKIALCYSEWKYFCTFTFDPAKINRYDYDEVSKKFSRWLVHMKDLYPEMRYIVVPELHKDGAYHFHGLFSDHLPVTFVGDFHKTGRTYHVNDYPFGFTVAQDVQDPTRVSHYILKYISKDLCAVTKYRRRYWYTTALLKPNDSMKLFITKEKMQQFLEDHKDQVSNLKEVNFEDKKFLSYISGFLTPEAYDDLIFYAESFHESGTSTSFST